MVNKRGWLRIVEATIAIMIILVVVLSLSMSRRAVTETSLSENINPLLEEIAKNNSMRDKIIGAPLEAESAIKEFLSKRIKGINIGYDARVCEIDVVCGISGAYPKDIVGNIYAGSRLISSSLMAGTEPKKVTIFLWYRER